MYTTITKQASQLQQIAGISECVTSTSEHGAGPQWVMQRVNDGQIPYRFCEPKCSAYIRGLLTTEDIAFLNEFQTSVDDLRLCSSNQADYRTSDRHERDQVHHDALSTAVFKLYHGVCRVPASWWSTLPCINFFTVLHSGGHWWCTAGEGMGRRGKGGGGGGGQGISNSAQLYDWDAVKSSLWLFSHAYPPTGDSTVLVGEWLGLSFRGLLCKTTLKDAHRQTLDCNVKDNLGIQ